MEKIMEKTFDVEGIAKIMVMYRGMFLQPKSRFNVKMTEKELNDYRDFMDIIKCEEIGSVVQEASKSDPIVEPQPKIEEEPKGESENVVQVQQRKSGSNKNSNKAKVQSTR